MCLFRCAAALAPFVILAIASPARGGDGLVLSGGGARGLAHVGVVLGIEQRGFDPEIVVGTSMGAIVGGLYSAGYGGRAIDSIFVREDWRNIFTPFPLEVGPSRRLRYPAFRFDAAGRHSLGLRGYVPDWRINLRLTQLLFDASARARGDFDRLPRRFRSVTADAANGDLVVLSRGDLARSIRASMAVAGFFAPMRFGHRLLTDGGIADYLPVAEARRLGGSPIIASDVIQPPDTLQNVDALSVARRSVDVMTLRVRERVAPDVLIRPGIDPAMAPFSYPIDPTPVIREGLKATLQAEFPGASNEAPDGVRTLPPAPRRLAGVVVEDAGSIQGPRSELDAFLARELGGVGARAYDRDRILGRISRIYATGLFDGVWASVEDSTGQTAPLLRVQAESRGPTSLAGAPGYDNDRGGRLWASVRRIDAIGAYPLELAVEGGVNGVDTWGSLSARIADTFDRVALTTGLHVTQKDLRFAVPADRQDVEVTRTGTWLGLETRWLDPSVHAAVVFHAEDIRSDFGPDGGSYGPWVRVSRIEPIVPVVGTDPTVEFEARFGDVAYRVFRARGSVTRRAGPLAMALVADAAGVSREAPLDAAPSMGGEGMIPGLREGERMGRARLVGGVDAAASAPFGTTLRVRSRAGVIADETRVDRQRLYTRESLWLGGARLSALWWTPFGRVELGGEASTLGDRRFVVALGTDF